MFYAYIKLAYPFWNNQPVFHRYDYWRYFYTKPFIVHKHRPMKTKFCDFNQITTIPYIEVTTEQKKDLVYLLKCNFISNDRILCLIEENDMDAYYSGHNDTPMISFYNEKKYDLNKFAVDASFSTQYENVVTSLKPIGCILSYPVQFYFRYSTEENVYTQMPTYFIEFLCVHREHDQKAISRKLVQTHEYNQRTKNPSVQCSLIKKEIDLFDGVIPLVEYTTYVFYLRNILFGGLPAHFHITHLDLENIDLLTDFLHTQTHLDLERTTTYFDVIILADIGNLISQIKNNSLYAFCLRNGEHIYGMYFFKDAKLQYEDIEGNTLQFCGSVMNCNTAELFYLGYLHSLQEIVKKKKNFKMLMFEDIGDNRIIFEYWRQKNTPVFNNRTAYYTYNFIYPCSPLAPGKCFILGGT